MSKIKTKIVIGYILVSSLNFGLNFGNAQRSASTVNSVDKFRDQKLQMVQDVYQKDPLLQDDLGSSDAGQSVVSANNAEKQLQMMSDQFDSIVDEFNRIKDRRTDMEKKYQDLVASLKEIVKDANEEKKVIADRVSKIRFYNDKINSLNVTLSSLKSDIDNTKSDLKTYTQALYTINNDYYGKDLKIDDIKLLVKSDNVSHTLSNEEIVKALSVKLDELMGMLQENEKKYQSYNDSLMELKSKYKTQALEYKKDLDNLTQQKQYIYQMVLLIKDNKQDLEDRYNSLSEDRKNIREQILSIINIAKDSGYDFKGKGPIGESMARLLASQDNYATGDKFFTWPVLDFKRISTFFDDPDYLKEFGSLHKAIDISVAQGSEVYAPADGIVYKVVNNDSISTNRLMIFHKNGYVTVYLHMNQIFAKEGDYVKKGTIIGLSGGKPGTRGAGMLTTGPHLHFEIIKNGNYTDPLTELDLSLFASSKGLPQKYHLQYLKDKFARKVNLTDVKYLDGDSARERRQNFLIKYAASQFKDVEIREAAAKEKNIDVDLGICVGFAETGLGNHLASKNNIGNVGNNDKGDRVNFSDPSIGVKSIYYALGNKLLSQHQTVDQLSRFGNKTGTIYASSDFNWEKNIIRCMTSIKGYRVPEDYPFRTSN